MEKHNPSSFTVDSSSPAHRSSFAIHDLTPYINWIYFFHAWDSNRVMLPLPIFTDVTLAVLSG